MVCLSRKEFEKIEKLFNFEKNTKEQIRTKIGSLYVRLQKLYSEIKEENIIIDYMLSSTKEEIKAEWFAKKQELGLSNPEVENRVETHVKVKELYEKRKIAYIQKIHIERILECFTYLKEFLFEDKIDLKNLQEAVISIIKNLKKKNNK